MGNHSRKSNFPATNRAWGPDARRVRAVPRGACRASSPVDCVNSVARIQQPRHGGMTRRRLDLERLYRNPRRSRTDDRNDRSAHGLLGMKLPELTFWEFLKQTAEQLRQGLSATGHAP
jgi:hypothetical protein